MFFIIFDREIGITSTAWIIQSCQAIYYDLEVDLD